MSERNSEELIDEIGLAFLKSVPQGWGSAELRMRQVGKAGEFTSVATMEDGSEVRFVMPMAALMALSDMREVMARPGTGAWFTAVIRIGAPSKMDFDFDFDFDNEPERTTPTSVGHYLEEWEKHPRAPEHTPEWLVDRLAQARAWDAEAR